MYEPDWIEDTSGCLHRNRVLGLRIPLRYGSAATVHCIDCGYWAQERSIDKSFERWSPHETFADALIESDEL